MTIEDVYRYMISGYFGVMGMDSYKLKEYVLADIKQYIKDYMEQNPSNNFNLDEEIEVTEWVLIIRIFVSNRLYIDIFV